MTLSDVQTPLISFSVAVITSLVVYLLTTLFRFWWIKLNMKLEEKELIGSRVTVRIFNNSIFPMNDTYAYITIVHEKSDVRTPPDQKKSYIYPPDNSSRGHLCIVQEDRLCWSMASNPASLNIYSGERQSLDIANFDPKHEWIEIPSESGWGTVGGISRVFLKWKKYEATIKIVSKDSKAKEFSVQIDPDNV